MDNEKKEVIVYGLGKDFAYWKTWIETKYNVLGYADSDKEKAEQYHPFLRIKEIQDRQENVLIVSTDYYDEIKSLLIENGIDEKRKDGEWYLGGRIQRPHDLLLFCNGNTEASS